VLAGLAAAGKRCARRAAPPRPGEFPGGVEVARADLADPASWPAALAGGRKVFLYAHPEGAPEFAAAARKAGVERVVLRSSSTVLYPDAPARSRCGTSRRNGRLTRPGLTGPSCGQATPRTRCAGGVRFGLLLIFWVHNSRSALRVSAQPAVHIVGFTSCWPAAALRVVGAGCRLAGLQLRRGGR
jgi:hypothetical protein